jgi:DNA-binding CsgD family transcriptional regulator
LPEAKERLTEAAALARQEDDARSLALALSLLGLVARARGDLEGADASLAEAERLWQARGGAWGLAVTNLGQAMIALDRQDAVRAAALCRASLDMRLAERDVWGLCQCLIIAAALMHLQGESGAAVRILGAEAATREASGGSLSPGLRQTLDDLLPATRAALGTTGFQSAWDAGAAIGAIDIAAEAMTFLASVTEAPGAPPAAAVLGLTPRERDVLRLLAAGKTDREIAEALFISRYTAMKHVANILGKLDVNTRTAAAAAAFEHGLT